MKGFDAEFRDLPHYILTITDRIWEGRRIDDIRRYYGEGCAVETPGSVSIGIEPVIEGTRATLRAFPDRRLLAEDVIFSGDDEAGYLSSHRIFSPMTHAGPGAFGAASGKPVFARTIADCVCINNRIVHEWLVRDQAAIARQIGVHERDLAQRWLNEGGALNKPPMPPAPAPYRSFIDPDRLAQAYAQTYRQLWTTGSPQAMDALFDAQAIVALPGGEVATHARARQDFWASLLTALSPQAFTVEHLVANPRQGRGGDAVALAMRWRARTSHVSPGRYGRASGRPVEILGISHAELQHGRVVREWVLIDEVATWLQVLQPEA